jgi:hypothetical protein
MRSILVSLLLVVTVKSSAQISIVCPGLTDSTLNYFYIGVSNPIEVKGVKMSGNHKIIISGSGAHITSMGDNKYIIRTAAAVTDSSIVKIYEGKKEIFSKPFKIRRIPDEIATLSGLHDTTIRRQRILANPFLVVVSPKCYFKLNWRMVSFTAIFINGTDSIPTFAQGNLLSKEQIQLVKDAEAGSKIYFEDIRAYGTDSRTRKIYDFWIKIE